jgi:MYXO-CTERM domain-containing protein
VRRPLRSLSLAAFSLSLTVVTPTRAAAQQVVVNGGAPNQGIGQNIVDDGQAATSFSLTDAINFDAIRFWGLLGQSTPYNPDIFWQVLADDGGMPGSTVVASGDAIATPTLDGELQDFPGFYSWQFDLGVGPQTLGSGIFWLALHDGRVDPSPDALFDPTAYTGSGLIWETSDAAGANMFQQFDVAPDWGPTGDTELAFELTNANSVVTTPEPATFTLLATGLFGMAGIAARRRRRRS